MHVLITGASGFIGTALCWKLLSKKWQVRGTVRPSNRLNKLPAGVNAVQIGSIGPDTNWSEALVGVDCVVHLAARVHIMRDTAYDPLTLFRHVNVLGTERLAREAALANARRFIYISSVKVNGEGRSTPYREEDIQKPQDAYSVSKWEAEKVVNKIAVETGIETVIIRSPLVYGPRVKANFLRLLELVERGIPLPFASVNNRRSFIYLDNLVDAIVTCIENPRVSGQTYLVSDGEDVSVPDLLRRLGSAFGRPARLFPFSPFLMHMAARIFDKSIAIERLLGSLTVDISKIRRDLNWKAPFSMDQGLRETAKWYKKEGRSQESEVRCRWRKTENK